LLLVLGFPLILLAGYALVFVLSGRNASLLAGPIGFLLYLALLAIPLIALLVARPELPGEVLVWRRWTAGWIMVGAASGMALWGMRWLLRGQAEETTASPIWLGPAGRLGFAVLMVPVTYLVVAEELVWRGYLLPEIGLLLSAGAFALHHYHFGARHVLFAFFAGLVWGGLFVLFHELWPSIASHLTYNALAWGYLRRRARA
jgi:membrane protease YdiL (CAAX protease family)